MTAIVSLTPIPGRRPSSPSFGAPSALLGSSPTALPDLPWGRITGGRANHPYWLTAPAMVPVVERVQPPPVSALWLMAAGRKCLRTSHVGRLMVEAARLRTVSETDRTVQAAWDSDEDHDDEARDPMDVRIPVPRTP
ncbi:hypothetical protein [Streptomyces sp. NBC_01462]|uniref:hypothetical protein n=1 Tax=Streptomyces sp. NBC_01462 TaxID=2903876 RepID=UPI002E332FE0|nr:hypothetical protein [Streptomyces sp. NBC_01462]